MDDGEYTCQLLKCAVPEDGGCNATPDEFDKYDVLRTKPNKNGKGDFRIRETDGSQVVRPLTMRFEA